MTNALKEAVAVVEQLPEADQEHIGRKVLQHVEKLRELRAEIDKGARELDAGKGVALDIDDVIATARKRHGTRH